jgi:hypothetical protein
MKILFLYSAVFRNKTLKSAFKKLLSLLYCFVHQKPSIKEYLEILGGKRINFVFILYYQIPYIHTYRIRNSLSLAIRKSLLETIFWYLSRKTTFLPFLLPTLPIPTRLEGTPIKERKVADSINSSPLYTERLKIDLILKELFPLAPLPPISQ